MGFDIYGENPKLKNECPTIDWNNSTKEEQKQYFIDKEKFEEENPGYYFRNNVWWWRPLASLIAESCKDLLTEEQADRLHDNSGCIYDQDIAEGIARRLEKLVENGELIKYEKKHNQEMQKAKKHNEKISKELEKLKLEVKKIRPDENLAPINYPFPYNKHWEEINAKKNWADSYPFSVDNVKDFINFARHSGGFQIC